MCIMKHSSATSVTTSVACPKPASPTMPVLTIHIGHLVLRAAGYRRPEHTTATSCTQPADANAWAGRRGLLADAAGSPHMRAGAAPCMRVDTRLDVLGRGRPCARARNRRWCAQIHVAFLVWDVALGQQKPNSLSRPDLARSMASRVNKPGLRRRILAAMHQNSGAVQGCFRGMHNAYSKNDPYNKHGGTHASGFLESIIHLT